MKIINLIGRTIGLLQENGEIETIGNSINLCIDGHTIQRITDCSIVIREKIEQVPFQSSLILLSKQEYILELDCTVGSSNSSYPGRSFSSSRTQTIEGWPEAKPETLYLVPESILPFVPDNRNDFVAPIYPILDHQLYPIITNGKQEIKVRKYTDFYLSDRSKSQFIRCYVPKYKMLISKGQIIGDIKSVEII